MYRFILNASVFNQIFLMELGRQLNELMPSKTKTHCAKYFFILLICQTLAVNASYAEVPLHENTLRISATSSLLDSGVMKALLDDFSKRNPKIKIELNNAGALEVLKFAREGKADVVISHHPPGEKRFVDQGYGRDRTQFVYSEFVLFGPPGELPELSKATDIIEALKILAEEEVDFLVPSSRSGVFAVIEELWVTAGIDPTWIGYENTGISGASNLRQAAEMNAYTIMDYGTYLANKDKYANKISPLISGDFSLRNIYSITIVNANKVKGVNEKLAQKFYDYVIGEKGQEVISRYGEKTLNVSFLTPAANFDINLREKRAKESAQHYKQQSEAMQSLFVASSLFFTLTILLLLGIRRSEKKRHASEAIAYECFVDRDSAVDANKSKSSFLANMSHELRTPLTTIIGYNELLEDEVNENNLRETNISEYLHNIDNAAHHLLALISDILDLSKIEAGKIALCPRKTNIPALIHETCTTIRPLVIEKNNELAINISTDIGSFFVDDTKLKQILLNLLSNACKFTHNGEISLNVKNSSNHWIIFEICDTGIGITKEQQKNIFDTFVQADNSTTREHGGTGLGLAISKHFCHLMGGEITVESELGKGAIFTVKLPNDIKNQ